MDKAKRIVSFFIFILAAVFAFSGCQRDPYQRERFCGIVRHSEESNRLVVYVPEIGDVEIPDFDRCIAGFDGYEENESTAYALKAGDFVAIHFKYKKAWDENGVKIMETHPAKFDRKANLIEALKESIAFEKIENGYEISFPETDAEEAFTMGDRINFIYHSGKNGAAYKARIADGVVTDLSDGKITAVLNLLVSEKEFFERLTSATIEKPREDAYDPT